MTSVACVGISVLDVVFDIPAIPTQPGKYRAQRRTEVGGGVAANAAVAVTALGGSASLFGSLGDDAAGDRIVAGLAERGVDTGGIRRASGLWSPLSSVMIDAHGERLIVNHTDPALFTSAPPPTAAELAGCDLVLADMRWPEGAVAALRIAKSQSLPAIVDCDHDPADAPGIIEEATHVVFALPTLAALTGVAEPFAALSAAARHTPAWVAATAGADGVYWLDDGRLHHQPAFDVDVVDTLGAGDVFHGAFALAVAEGAPLANALRWAAAAAAIKCTRFGGRAGTPSRHEVESFLEEQRA